VTLVDTSVWIDHFRRRNAALAALLEEGAVLSHPLVIGEIACGGLRNRTRILADLAALPAAIEMEHESVLRFVHDRELWNKGVGWIDVHLLASAMVSHCTLWTLDTSLRRAAAMLGVARS
jgi:predicted nucleic acid-binding protein